MIRYVGFHCDAERGDFGWSDEVYLITSAAHITAGGANVVRSEKHPLGASEYSNVDVGDTRLGPIAACWQGSADPVSLTAVAFEHDYGDPNHYREEVDAAVKVAIVIAAIYLGPEAAAVYVLEEATGLSVTESIGCWVPTISDRYRSDCDLTRRKA